MGSEMCIRDRIGVEVVHLELRRLEIMDPQRDRLLPHEGVHPPETGRLDGPLVVAEEGEDAALVGLDREEACLLYTSDAADERSSVDLGGRRIIKKKNRDESVR